MRSIICYSRLGFTAHSLCSFSCTEFPWASQVLCWCKCEQSQSSDLYIPSIHLHIFNHLFVCLSGLLSPATSLADAVFSNGSGMSKPESRCGISPSLQHLWGVWVPQNRNGLASTGQALCSHGHREESPVCCRGPAEAALPAGLIRRRVPVPVPCLEPCD